MKAVILAGGKGTRLAPYTTVLPKPLVPVGGIPIMETVLHQLHHHGFDEIVLAVGYLSSLIRAYFDLAPIASRIRLRYHQEREPLGTAGALASITGLDEDYLAMNGDLLTTLDFSALMKVHQERDAALTIAVTEQKIQIQVGVLKIDEDARIIGYDEKPIHRYRASMGIYACSPRLQGFLVPGQPLDMPDLVMRLIAAGETVAAYSSEATWLDMGNRIDYERACEAFDQDRAAFLPDEKASSR